METEFAITKCGGSREALAKILGVKAITTYQPSWQPDLPPKHERFLRAVRPKWFREWEDLQKDRA